MHTDQPRHDSRNLFYSQILALLKPHLLGAPTNSTSVLSNTSFQDSHSRTLIDSKGAWMSSQALLCRWAEARLDRRRRRPPKRIELLDTQMETRLLFQVGFIRHFWLSNPFLLFTIGSPSLSLLPGLFPTCTGDRNKPVLAVPLSKFLSSGRIVGTLLIALKQSISNVAQRK